MSNSQQDYDGVKYFSAEEGPQIDVLSDILRALRLHASSYFCIEFSAPWGIDEPKNEFGIFHVVIHGEAWVTAPSLENPIYLSKGDIIAFPTGSPHNISDKIGNNMVSGISLLDMVKQGRNPFPGKKNVATLLCGYFEYEKQILLPLLRDMPALLHIKSRHSPKLNWLNNISKALANESRSLQPGGAVIIDRLTEVLVIQLLRWHVNHQENREGYFEALADNQLSHALSLMHKLPNKAWTLEKLGEAIGMSRTAFANRFRDIVGMTPIAYLGQWRMHLAHQLLSENNESMLRIAEKVGYKSEASFGKAFKKITGLSPGKVRNTK